MSYDIEKLSLKALEKIFLVLDDIKYNIEIQNKTKWLNMGKVEGIDGISKIEHRRIMESLLENTDFLFDTPYTAGDCCLEVRLDKLDLFLQKVSARIRELKGEHVPKENSSKRELAFDKIESILFIDGYEVKIAVRDKKTVAHDILEYILVDNCENLGDDFYYSEIAFDKFGDEKYKSNPTAWRKYHAACMDIQDKIRKQTANKIDDFLIYNASQKGRVKINQKYLT